MNLDDLRSILLSERETGRLTAISPDIFKKGHAELAAITRKVYGFEDPFSDEARSLIDETISIRETLHELFAIRTRKILALTMMHAEGNYYDREEVKRMIPPEREMFEQATAAIEQGQRVLLQNQPHVSITAAATSPVSPESLVSGVEDEVGDGGPPSYADEPAGPGPQALPVAGGAVPAPIVHPCALVRVLEDMDSFMGVDGRIYTLSKGDIVTLPERNAAVLSERNIVLNINLCK